MVDALALLGRLAHGGGGMFMNHVLVRHFGRFLSPVVTEGLKGIWTRSGLNHGEARWWLVELDWTEHENSTQPRGRQAKTDRRTERGDWAAGGARFEKEGLCIHVMYAGAYSAPP